jgi:hypothetical protein
MNPLVGAVGADRNAPAMIALKPPSKELSITEPKRRQAEGFRSEDNEDEPHKFYSGKEPD